MREADGAGIVFGAGVGIGAIMDFAARAGIAAKGDRCKFLLEGGNGWHVSSGRIFNGFANRFRMGRARSLSRCNTPYEQHSICIFVD